MVRSTLSASLTVMRALFAGRPLIAATTVWNPASPSPGIEVWTSRTLGSCWSFCSALMAWSRTACDEAPAGGAMVTWRSFSDPALMNAVGRSGARTAVSRNSPVAMPTTPSLVLRLRSAAVIAGVYTLIQKEFFGSPSSSTLDLTSLIRR